MKYIHKIQDSKILDITKLLVPSAGQIFSTQLAENKLFRLELYSLAKGESISGHNLLETTLYFVTSGSLLINDNVLKSGYFEVIEKSVSSKLLAKEDCQVLFYTFFETPEKDFYLQNLPSNTSGLLAEQVEYRENSVASKTLIQKEKLSITLFALDQEEGLSTHAASGDALVIALEGTNHIEIDKKPFDIKQGECIILPANIAHSLKATSRFKMFLTVVKQ